MRYDLPNENTEIHGRPTTRSGRASGWMMKIAVLPVVLSLASAGQAGPLDFLGPKGDTVAEKQATVRKQSDTMLGELYAAKPDLKDKIAKAAGYATFRQTDVNLLLLASSHGYGVLVENKPEASKADQKTEPKETFMRVASLGGGVGAGVKDLRVVFIFNDAKVMKQFVEQGWQFGGQADAGAKAGDTGVSAGQSMKANADFKDGTASGASSTDARAGRDANEKASTTVSVGGAMEVYQFTESGISLQATVSGTKYWKDTELNKVAESSK